MLSSILPGIRAYAKDNIIQGDRKGAPVQYTDASPACSARILYGRTLAVALEDILFCIGSNARQYA